MPTCIATTKRDMITVVEPMPPCADRQREIGGIHRFNPHQANIVAAFISVRATVSDEAATR